MKFTLTYGFDDKTYAIIPCIMFTFRNSFGILILILNLVITIEVMKK